MPLSRQTFLPVLTSKAPGAQAELAVVTIHGAPRSAEAYFEHMVQVVGEQRQESSTVVVAPAFADKSCTAEAWLKGAGQRTAMRSPAFGPIANPFWMFGDRADQDVTRDGITTFAALDALLAWIQEVFVSIKRIVLFGFSSGGLLLQRWSILSPEGINGKTRGGLQLRIIVGGVSSFAYLDTRRPAPACSPDWGPIEHPAQFFVSGHRCNSFPVPHEEQAGRNKSASFCGGDYDTYPWGLGGLAARGDGPSAHQTVQLGEGPQRSSNSLLEAVAGYAAASGVPMAGEAAMRAALRARFAAKDLRYLIGRADTESCNIGVCFDYCPAMTTGSNRLQRGLNYMDYLRIALGPLDFEPRFALYDAGHSDLWACQTFPFRSWLFEANPVQDEYRMMPAVVKDEGKTVRIHDSTFFSLQQCIQFCEEEYRCQSLAYDSLSGYCFLKDQCVTAEDAVEPGNLGRVDGPNFRTYFHGSRPCAPTALAQALTPAPAPARPQTTAAAQAPAPAQAPAAVEPLSPPLPPRLPLPAPPAPLPAPPQLVPAPAPAAVTIGAQQLKFLFEQSDGQFLAVSPIGATLCAAFLVVSALMLSVNCGRFGRNVRCSSGGRGRSWRFTSRAPSAPTEQERTCLLALPT